MLAFTTKEVIAKAETKDWPINWITDELRTFIKNEEDLIEALEELRGNPEVTEEELDEEIIKHRNEIEEAESYIIEQAFTAA